MELYNVNTPEYLHSTEFKDIVNFINNIRNQREINLLTRHPSFQVNPRCQKDQDISFSFVERNTPFFDMPCETLLHKNNNGWIDIIEWHYHLNCFHKGIYHRIEWSKLLNHNPDKFLHEIYQDWITNKEFQLLMTQSTEAFSLYNLLDYHKNFIYNEQIEPISLDDVRELFDALTTEGVFLNKDGDLYQVYENLELEQANTNVKRKYYSGQIPKMDELHVRSTFAVKTLSTLQRLKTKINFIPNNIKGFDGIWLIQKLGGKICFIPQNLVFYNKRVYNQV
jgi:hypothetical protein